MVSVELIVDLGIPKSGPSVSKMMVEAANILTTVSS